MSDARLNQHNITTIDRMVLMAKNTYNKDMYSLQLKKERL